jgi:hypothetical protein
MKPLLLVVGLISLGACAAPYEAMPQSSYQWQRRQDAIEQNWRASQPAPQTTTAAKDKP